MKVTFPYVNAITPVFGELFETLGNEVVLPTRPTQQTLTLGVRYAPEFACLPLKILLGTYIEALEKGADTIVATGGVGPCRAGQYAQIHELVLRDIGYSPRMLVFEPPRLDWLGFFRTVSALNVARLSPLAIYRVAMYLWEKVKALDALEVRAAKVRAREVEKGATSRAYRRALPLIYAARTKAEVADALAEGMKLIDSVEQDPSRRPLRVGVVGEIYVLIEPSANLEIEEMMGELGVEVTRSIYLSGWAANSNLFDSRENEGTYLKKVARDYMPEMVGGHGQDSVAHAILYARAGFDGVVQLAPFTCIPEIVAKSILGKVSKDFDIPVLSVMIDEQTGKAGLQTRIEAFVDLLQKRRDRREAMGLARTGTDGHGRS